MKILNGNFKLGGQGKTVEIDKSMFKKKKKYNHGCVSEGQWMFGMVERDTGRSVAFDVPDCQRETLATRLVSKFVERGTVIISDRFSLHFNPSCPKSDFTLSNGRQFLFIQGREKICQPLCWSTQATP